ncbi:Hint domain-containing protein [Chelatococcus reniformis]|uniref:Hint domain-containing protein n=1 Tax=Chelatococcus reniformis TaxID=1494448 RepID=A0A916XJI4_9HYPH|nr:Hint domain-containing protein [Chelatococcus reniformis]GGC76750.1 hypothetical protein GCM10010994_38820 [Chelatococcus reniformis]
MSTAYLDTGTNSVIKVANGGTLVNTGWTGGSGATYEVEGASTLDFSGATAGGGGIVGETVIFSGVGHGTVKLPGGVLDYANPNQSGLTVQGFGSGDLLLFGDAHITEFRTIGNGDGTMTIQAVDVQSVWYTHILSSVTLSGNFDPTHFVFDPALGTVSYACFLAGTMIATPDGEVAVEELRIGDLVLGADGRSRPVRWIGRRQVVAMFADPVQAYPVRIVAGALGGGLPVRDLLLSPDHALLVDGVLVQAGALVNGSSIARVERPDARFTYFHIELDDHALILAEGAPAETFVDNVTRRRFDNYSEYEALFGDGEACIPELELPRIKSARQMPRAMCERLSAEAAALGFLSQAAA